MTACASCAGLHILGVHQAKAAGVEADLVSAEQAFALWACVKPRLQELGRCYQALLGLEMPLTPVLAAMELRGIAIDLTHLQQQLVGPGSPLMLRQASNRCLI